MSSDLVIKGGRVIDGTGAASFTADVGITDGRISEIGTGLSGARTLDATDHVVAPGFIDIHTHYDAQVFWDRALSPSCYHGVTTVMAGNCGFSLAPVRPEDVSTVISTLERVEDMNAETLRAGVPWGSFESFGDYLDVVERGGVQLNFGCYIGHTAVRLFVMGEASQERSATAAEVLAMQQIIREALLAGAAGFATSFGPTHVGAGGKPVPSRFADMEELLALLQPLRELNRGVVTILLGEHVTAVDLPAIQRAAGRPVTWTPMLVREGYPHQELLAQSKDARQDGCDLWPQTSARPVTFQETLGDPFTFNRFPAFAELAGAAPGVRAAAYADPVWRTRARAETGGSTGRPVEWSRMEVAETGRHPQLVGRSIAQIAQELGQMPLDVALDIALVESLDTRFRVTVANDDRTRVGELVADDVVLLGLGDGGAHVGQICDACFPTDVLSTWVRQRGVLTLERAVWKLSGLPAEAFGLRDRGRLTPGAAADVVVFQPETVDPGPARRTRDLPANGERLVADTPSGVRHVVVNGVPIRVDEQQIDASQVAPGQVLRSEWAAHPTQGASK